MDYEHKIIEFLSQGQNLSFLFEVETLIPKVRSHLRKELNDAFFDNLRQNSVLNGYSPDRDKNNIFYRNPKYQDEKYYNLGVCIRLDADETFFWNYWISQH